LVPLLRALEQPGGVVVALVDGVRPCATVYADDLKVFADSDWHHALHFEAATSDYWSGATVNPTTATSNHSAKPPHRRRRAAACIRRNQGSFAVARQSGSPGFR
jgi:hypothetical protein